MRTAVCRRVLAQLPTEHATPGCSTAQASAPAYKKAAWVLARACGFIPNPPPQQRCQACHLSKLAGQAATQALLCHHHEVQSQNGAALQHLHIRSISTHCSAGSSAAGKSTRTGHTLLCAENGSSVGGSHASSKANSTPASGAGVGFRASHGWLHEGKEHELFQQALEGVAPDAALGIMKAARTRSRLRELGPHAMADAVRTAVEVHRRFNDIRAEELLASAISSMQASEVLQRAQRLKRVLPDTRLTTGLLGLDAHELSRSILALSHVFRTVLETMLPPKLLRAKDLRYLTSLSPDTVAQRLEQLKEALGREATVELVLQQPRTMVRWTDLLLDKAPGIVQVFGVSKEVAVGLLCQHRKLWSPAVVEQMQRLCSVMAEHLGLPAKDLLLEVVKQPLLALHTSAALLLDKYKALAELLPDAPLPTLLSLLAAHNAASAPNGQALARSLQYTAQLLGHTPASLVQALGKASQPLYVNFVLQAVESMQARVEGLHRVLGVPQQSLVQALRRTPSLLFAEPRLLQMKLHFLTEQLVASPPSPHDIQRLAATLCQGSEKVLLLAGTTWTDKVAALQASLGMPAATAKAIFASCPRLLLLSKAALEQRAQELSRALGGNAAAQQMLAEDPTVLVSLSSAKSRFQATWMAALLNQPREQAHALALRSPSGRTLLLLKPESAQARLRLIAGVLGMEQGPALGLLLGGGYIDKCNLVRSAPSTLLSTAQVLCHLLGLHSPQQLGKVLQRMPALLKAKPTSLAAKQEVLSELLGHPGRQRLQQLLAGSPYLLMRSERTLRGSWARLVMAVEGCEEWRLQLRRLVQHGPSNRLGRVLLAGPKAVDRLQQLQQTEVMADASRRRCCSPMTLTTVLLESDAQFQARLQQAQESSQLQQQLQYQQEDAPLQVQQVQQRTPSSPKAAAAEALLLEQLAKAQAAGSAGVPMAHVQRLALAAGISATTFKRALDKMRQSGRVQAVSPAAVKTKLERVRGKYVASGSPPGRKSLLLQLC